MKKTILFFFILFSVLSNTIASWDDIEIYTEDEIFTNIIEALNERCIAVGTNNVNIIDWVETRQITGGVRTVYQIFTTKGTNQENVITTIESITGNDRDDVITNFNNGTGYTNYPIHGYPYIDTTESYVIYNAFEEWDFASADAVKTSFESALPDETIYITNFNFSYTFSYITTNIFWLASNSVSFITSNNLNLIDNKIKELAPYFLLSLPQFLNGPDKLYQEWLYQSNVTIIPGPPVDTAITNYIDYLPYIVYPNFFYHANIGTNKNILADSWGFVTNCDPYWTSMVQDSFKFLLAEYTYFSNSFEKVYENGSNSIGMASHPFFKYFFNEGEIYPTVEYIKNDTNTLFTQKEIRIRGNFMIDWDAQTLASEVGGTNFSETLILNSPSGFARLPWTSIYSNGIGKGLDASNGSTGDTILIYWDISNYKSYLNANIDHFPHFLLKTNLQERIKYIKNLLYIEFPYYFSKGTVIESAYFKSNNNYFSQMDFEPESIRAWYDLEGVLHACDASDIDCAPTFIIPPEGDPYLDLAPWPFGYLGEISGEAASALKVPPWQFWDRWITMSDPPYFFTNEIYANVINTYDIPPFPLDPFNIRPTLIGSKTMEAFTRWGWYYYAPFQQVQWSEALLQYVTAVNDIAESYGPVYGDISEFGTNMNKIDYSYETNDIYTIIAYPFVTNIVTNFYCVIDFYGKFTTDVEYLSYTNEYYTYLGTALKNDDKVYYESTSPIDPNDWLTPFFNFIGDHTWMVDSPDGPTYAQTYGKTIIGSNTYPCTFVETLYVQQWSEDPLFDVDVAWGETNVSYITNYEYIVVTVRDDTWFTAREIIEENHQYAPISYTNEATYQTNVTLYGPCDTDWFAYLGVELVQDPISLPATNDTPYIWVTNYNVVDFFGVPVTNEYRYQYHFYGNQELFVGVTNYLNIPYPNGTNLTYDWYYVTNGTEQLQFKYDTLYESSQKTDGSVNYDYYIREWKAVVKYNFRYQ